MLPFPLLLLNLLHFFNHPAHHILSFSQKQNKENPTKEYRRYKQGKTN